MKILPRDTEVAGKAEGSRLCNIYWRKVLDPESSCQIREKRLVTINVNRSPIPAILNTGTLDQCTLKGIPTKQPIINPSFRSAVATAILAWDTPRLPALFPIHNNIHLEDAASMDYSTLVLPLPHTSQWQKAHQIRHMFGDPGIPSPASMTWSEMTVPRSICKSINRDMYGEAFESHTLDEPCAALLDRFFREQDSEEDRTLEDDKASAMSNVECHLGILSNASGKCRRSRHSSKMTDSSSKSGCSGGLSNFKDAVRTTSVHETSQSLSPGQVTMAESVRFWAAFRNQKSRIPIFNDDNTTSETAGADMTSHQPVSKPLDSLTDCRNVCDRYNTHTPSESGNKYYSTTAPKVSSPLRSVLKAEGNPKRRAYKKKARLRYTRYKLNKCRPVHGHSLSFTEDQIMKLDPTQYNPKRRTISHGPFDPSESSDVLKAIKATLEEKKEDLSLQNSQMRKTARRLESQLAMLTEDLVEHARCNHPDLKDTWEHYVLPLQNGPVRQRLLNIMLGVAKPSECKSSSIPLIPGQKFGGDDFQNQDEQRRRSHKMGGIKLLKQTGQLAGGGNFQDAFAILQSEPNKFSSLREEYVSLLEMRCRQYFFSVAHLTKNEKAEFLSLGREEMWKLYEQWLREARDIQSFEQLLNGGQGRMVDNLVEPLAIPFAEPLGEALNVLLPLSTCQEIDLFPFQELAYVAQSPGVSDTGLVSEPKNTQHSIGLKTSEETSRQTDNPQRSTFLEYWNMRVKPKPSKLRTLRKNKKAADCFGKDCTGYFRTVSQLDITHDLSDPEQHLDESKSLRAAQHPNPPYHKISQALSSLHLITVLENWDKHEIKIHGESRYEWDPEQSAKHCYYHPYEVVFASKPLPDPIGSIKLDEFYALDGREFEHIEDVAVEQGQQLDKTGGAYPEAIPRFLALNPTPERTVDEVYALDSCKFEHTKGTAVERGRQLRRPEGAYSKPSPRFLAPNARPRRLAFCESQPRSPLKDCRPLKTTTVPARDGDILQVGTNFLKVPENTTVWKRLPSYDAKIAAEVRPLSPPSSTDSFLLRPSLTEFFHHPTSISDFQGLPGYGPHPKAATSNEAMTAQWGGTHRPLGTGVLDFASTFRSNCLAANGGPPVMNNITMGTLENTNSETTRELQRRLGHESVEVMERPRCRHALSGDQTLLGYIPSSSKTTSNLQRRPNHKSVDAMGRHCCRSSLSSVQIPPGCSSPKIPPRKPVARAVLEELRLCPLSDLSSTKTDSAQAYTSTAVSKSQPAVMRAKDEPTSSPVIDDLEKPVLPFHVRLADAMRVELNIPAVFKEEQSVPPTTTNGQDRTISSILRTKTNSFSSAISSLELPSPALSIPTAWTTAEPVSVVDLVPETFICADPSLEVAREDVTIPTKKESVPVTARADTPPKVKRVDFADVKYAPIIENCASTNASTKRIYANSVLKEGCFNDPTLAHTSLLADGRRIQFDDIDLDRGGVKRTLILGDGKKSLRVLGSRLKLKAKEAFGSTSRASGRRLKGGYLGGGEERERTVSIERFMRVSTEIVGSRGRARDVETKFNPTMEVREKAGEETISVVG